MIPSAAFPPHSSTISLTARWAAIGGSSGLSPFSKRMEASVRTFSAPAVRRTLGPWKFADSSSTVVVLPSISLSRPPITPASATGTSASAMTSISSASFCSLPSTRSSASPPPPQPLLHPGRRLADLDAFDKRGDVARAEVGVGDLHLYPALDRFTPRSVLDRGLAHSRSGQRRHFVGYPPHGEQVRA